MVVVILISTRVVLIGIAQHVGYTFFMALAANWDGFWYYGTGSHCYLKDGLSVGGIFIEDFVMKLYYSSCVAKSYWVYIFKNCFIIFYFVEKKPWDASRPFTLRTQSQFPVICTVEYQHINCGTPCIVLFFPKYNFCNL